MDRTSKLSRRKFGKGLGIAAGIGIAASAGATARIVTPAQVEGPFHPVDPQSDTDIDMTQLAGRTGIARGEPILVRGTVSTAEGQVLEKALVDVWQANHEGRYSHARDPNPAPLDPDFQGWALMHTGGDGRYGFKTIKPGAYPLKYLGEEGWRCRHIHFKVSAPGYQELITQMYFEGDPLIEQDQEIAKAPTAQRHLLISRAVTDRANGLPRYTFNIVLAAE